MQEITLQFGSVSSKGIRDRGKWNLQMSCANTQGLPGVKPLGGPVISAMH